MKHMMKHLKSSLTKVILSLTPLTSGCLAFFFGILIISPAHATGHFTEVSKLDQKAKAKLASAIQSTFQFRLDPGISCTGTFISKQGHFLTAQHCIAGCLAKQNAILRTRASEDPLAVRDGENIYTDKFTVVQDKIDNGISCPGKILGKEQNFKIIMTGGQGWLFPKETISLFAKKFPDDQKFLFENGYENAFDFAVLQAENSNGKPLIPSNCLKLAKTAPPIDEKLKTVSFSCLDRDKVYTDGTKALYSEGYRTKGFTDSQYYKKTKTREPAFDFALVERKETFFSNLDMEKCGSGSPVLDNQLNIVGVATRVYKTSTDYEYGSLESVDIAQLWQDLLKKKSGSDIKEITNCEESETLQPERSISGR